MIEDHGSKATNPEASNGDQNTHKEGRSIIITNDNRHIYPTCDQTDSKKPNWVEKGTLFVLFFTLGAAAYAAYETSIMAKRTIDLASDSNKQLIASTRAWIVPISAKFDGKIVRNANMRIEINFENVGKEPAWDVGFNWAAGQLFPVTIDGKGTPYIDVTTNPWPINNTCGFNPLDVFNRRPIYPGSKNEIAVYVLQPPTQAYVTKDFMSKRQSFTVFGCFAYRTPIEKDKIRHSPFCFYWQPKREGPIDDGTFEFCASGSANAD